MKPIYPTEDPSRKDTTQSQTDVSGIGAEEHLTEEDIAEISENSKEIAESSVGRSETAGIELDKTIFTPGDPAELLNFAPDDSDPLGGDAETADEAALSFDNLCAEPKEENKGVRVIHKKVVRREKGGFIRYLSATIIYLIAVICAGILSAMLILSVANDVFAFVKDDSLYEITIDDPKMSLKELSEYLGDEGIIQYPAIFRLYVGLKDDGEITLKKGTFTLSPSFNYDKILNALNPAPVRKEVSITFPEGMTVDDMIDLFVANGIGSREGFVDVIENYEFDYWFLEDLELSEDRYYRLEGYLYPDTYRFYTDSTEQAALKKLLDNFKKKVPESYAEQCFAIGMTLDEAIIIASMIETECTWVSDYEYVSAVFQNRLASASFNGRLDSDATIQYILRHTTGSRKEELEEVDLQIDSPYNTRMYGGLPPGPICSPSLNALTAAIYPNEDCGYYYFVAQANGYNLYAKTYNQHLANIETVKKETDE